MQVLKLDGEMLRLAEQLKDEQSLLVFGRGYNYATALEAALKVRTTILTCAALLARHGVLCLLDNKDSCVTSHKTPVVSTIF